MWKFGNLEIWKSTTCNLQSEISKLVSDEWRKRLRRNGVRGL
jgi:hypothetical protein